VRLKVTNPASPLFGQEAEILMKLEGPNEKVAPTEYWIKLDSGVETYILEADGEAYNRRLAERITT